MVLFIIPSHYRAGCAAVIQKVNCPLGLWTELPFNLYSIKYFLVSLICLSLFVGFGARAEERYSKWGGNDTNLDALVEHLNELIDAAEKLRAADPRLLRDLRDAIAEYGGSGSANQTSAASQSEAVPDLPPQILVRMFSKMAISPATRPRRWWKGVSILIRASASEALSPSRRPR